MSFSRTTPFVVLGAWAFLTPGWYGGCANGAMGDADGTVDPPNAVAADTDTNARTETGGEVGAQADLRGRGDDSEVAYDSASDEVAANGYHEALGEAEPEADCGCTIDQGRVDHFTGTDLSAENDASSTCPVPPNALVKDAYWRKTVPEGNSAVIWWLAVDRANVLGDPGTLEVKWIELKVSGSEVPLVRNDFSLPESWSPGNWQGGCYCAGGLFGARSDDYGQKQTDFCHDSGRGQLLCDPMASGIAVVADGVLRVDLANVPVESYVHLWGSAWPRTLLPKQSGPVELRASFRTTGSALVQFGIDYYCTPEANYDPVKCPTACAGGATRWYCAGDGWIENMTIGADTIGIEHPDKGCGQSENEFVQDCLAASQDPACDTGCSIQLVSNGQCATRLRVRGIPSGSYFTFGCGSTWCDLVDVVPTFDGEWLWADVPALVDRAWIRNPDGSWFDSSLCKTTGGVRWVSEPIGGFLSLDDLLGCDVQLWVAPGVSNYREVWIRDSAKDIVSFTFGCDDPGCPLLEVPGQEKGDFTFAEVGCEYQKVWPRTPGGGWWSPGCPCRYVPGPQYISWVESDIGGWLAVAPCQ